MTGLFRWRLAGIGEASSAVAMQVSDGRYYVSSWRYGRAAAGEPSTIMRTEWFATRAEQQARWDSFTLDDADEPLGLP